MTAVSPIPPGKTVDFKNTILIMTSNIGSQYLLDGIDENGSIKPEAEAMVMQDLRAHFRPEFLNRLDETILFKPLTKDNISHIVDLMVADVNRRLEDRELKVELTDNAKDLRHRPRLRPGLWRTSAEKISPEERRDPGSKDHPGRQYQRRPDHRH